MSLKVCWEIQMLGAEFSVNDMKAWIHPTLDQWFRLLVQ